MAKVGRPSIYTEELAETICERLVEGESLKAICRDDAMPHVTTVFRWLAKDKKFRNRYAQARESQAEAFASEIVEIADAAKAEDVQVAKLRVDARKWVAARLVAPVYGQKSTTDLNLRTPDGIQVEHLSDDELEKRASQLANRVAMLGASANGAHANGDSGE